MQKISEKITNSYLLSIKKVFDFINTVQLDINDYTIVADVFLENTLAFFNSKYEIKTEFMDAIRNEVKRLKEDYLKNSELSKFLEKILIKDYTNAITEAKRICKEKIMKQLRKNIKKNHN